MPAASFSSPSRESSGGHGHLAVLVANALVVAVMSRGLPAQRR